MEVESTNQVIFNYLRERLIEGKEIIYKKDLLDAYNNRLPLEVEPVTDVRPIIQKILKEFENISLYKPTYGKQFLYKESLLAPDRRRIASKKNYFTTSYCSLLNANFFFPNKPAIVHTKVRHPYINWSRFDIQCDKHKTSNIKACLTINMHKTINWLEEDDTLGLHVLPWHLMR